MAGNYPIRELMGECAETWNNRDEPISPFFAAATFFAELKRRGIRYDTYVQTIITGGGHLHNTAYARSEAVERNVTNGLQTAELLDTEGVVDLGSSVEAAAMPVIEGWEPDNWMTFWPLVMGKPELHEMSPDRIRYLEQQFSQKIWERINFNGLDMEKYRDRTIPKAERLGHYAMHANALHEMLDTNHIKLNPIWRAISLFGMEESVGQETEKFYARLVGIRTFRAAMARVMPLEPNELSNEKLGKDIAALRNMGMQALASAPQQQFVLVEDRTPTNWNITDPIAT